MRISSKIFVVGGIPIGIAAAIGLVSLLLLNEANRARNGAVLAGTIYRTLQSAVMARDDYVHAEPAARGLYQHLFVDVTAQARAELAMLRDLDPGKAEATRQAESTLDQYVADMKRLGDVTVDNDRLIEGMRARAAALIALTDRARERQHASNADIVKSLTEGDRKLRNARDIVDGAVATRVALAAVQTDLLAPAGPESPEAGETRRRLGFDANRLRQATAQLVRELETKAGDASDDFLTTGKDIQSRLEAAFPSRLPPEVGLSGATKKILDDLATWCERMLKISSAEYRSLHDEAAQLLTYSVEAHETDLATQNVAIETLKLSAVAAAAFARRDEDSARRILEASRALADTISSLPISPLIQGEMIDALGRWRDGLEVTTRRLGEQNRLLSDMDGASYAVIDAARRLDAVFGDNAERNARFIRIVLVLGIATGLLIGGAAAFLVARSFTRPLAALQSRIVRTAREPDNGLIWDDGRRDELGDIARAANVFLIEIARRERALRKAKERADAALDTLKRTQAELIQAEKLASLGELVAGVAHEINTPIGIALTTSTTLEDELDMFRQATRDGRVSRGMLARLVERVGEGSSLLTANLSRAADLIQSFKHVAADQTSGERRPFAVATFLHQLLTSLGPMLRKSGHQVTMSCPETLEIDSYPGPLGQVITNLVVNASLHAFATGQTGTIEVAVVATPGGLRFTVSDDGRGIPPENRAKIFDPFFTTRRSRGSTGLGLHIVFNLVTSTLGGRIDLDPTTTTGARFIIDLPRAAATQDAKATDETVG